MKKINFRGTGFLALAFLTAIILSIFIALFVIYINEAFGQELYENSIYYLDPVIIQNVTLKADGTLEVIKTQSTGMMYPEGGSPPHNAFKYIFKAEDNKIVLDKIINGKYHPKSYQPIFESYEWDEEQ